MALGSGFSFACRCTLWFHPYTQRAYIATQEYKLTTQLVRTLVELIASRMVLGSWALFVLLWVF